MFTGIIHHFGVVESIQRTPRPRLVIAGAKISAKIGDSIAVDGVCLTVAAKRLGRFSFDLLRETLARTALGRLSSGDRVHLEPALKMGDPVGGHWVLGHVDGVGRVVRCIRRGSDVVLTIGSPATLKRYLAPQGSVALNGVSLTIARRSADSFQVHLIPETLRKTALGDCKVGDRLNIEVDPLARYAIHGRAASGR